MSEYHLEPLYEAYERLAKAEMEKDAELVLKIQNELEELRRKAVKESKQRGVYVIQDNYDSRNR